jgi:hypothetical protein
MFFEEALDIRVSPEHGGGHGTSEEPHEARLCGSPNPMDAERSRLSDLVVRHDHPLHLHT